MRVNYLDIANLRYDFLKPEVFKIKVSNMPKSDRSYTDEEVRQALESIRNWLK